LMQFPEYQQFAQATRKDKSKKETNEVDLETPVTQTPHESLVQATASSFQPEREGKRRCWCDHEE